MANTEFTISGLVESQLPDFINAKYAENAPSFRRFIELYYEWLENSTAGATVYQIMNAEKYRDVDETPDEFIELFKTELLPFFPNRTELEITKILKAAREFYLKKGTKFSIEWLFRVLFNKEAMVFLPKNNVLRVSDGKWQRPVSLKVSDTPFLVQSTESTLNLFAKPAAPDTYYTQKTFSTNVKFTNTLRRDSTIILFATYKIWVTSTASGSALRDLLLNYIATNPSTSVTNYDGTKLNLVERIVGEDLTGYGTNQHGFQIVECYYGQNFDTFANRFKFNNFMTSSKLETVFDSAVNSTLFQFDGIEAFEICRLGVGELIASNSAFVSSSTSAETTLSVDGANTPFYTISFGYSPDQSVFIDPSTTVDGGSPSTTVFDIIADGGDPTTISFDDIIDGGLYSTESGLLSVTTILPDDVNNVVLANTSYGEGNFALQYSKKYYAQDVTSSFSSSAAANIFTISFAFKERPKPSLQNLVGRYVIGETSAARAVIEQAVLKVDEYTKTQFTEIFLSNIQGEFINNELIYVDLDEDIFTERILGFVNNIRIDPNHRGLTYRVNDPAVIYGGFIDELGNRPGAGFSHATARVSRVTAGRILAIDLLDGGYGYKLNPNTYVDVIADPGDPVTRVANVTVTAVDLDNPINVSLSIDVIQPYADVVLSADPFNPSPAAWGTGFPSEPNANVNSVLADCFEEISDTFYTITELTINDQGEGYLTQPTLNFTTLYNVSGGTSQISSLGMISFVRVIEPGTGYANGEIVSFVGSGSEAQGELVVNGSGEITSVNITSRGYGYTTRPTATIATVSGSNAVLQPYLFNDGVEFNLIFEEVGKIQEVEIITPGFGYIAEPGVSLRVMDVYVSNLTRVFSADQILSVYQGADFATATFRANIDIGYVSSINQSGAALATIRIYNYTGPINESLPLIIKETGDSLVVEGYTIYGNGLARATLLFVDGTVTYPGYYLNTDGFLSADKKLQDDYKYHNYSYVLESDKQLSEYNQTIKNIAHPAGTRLIANKRISDVFAFRPSVSHGFSISESGYVLAEDGSYIRTEDGAGYLSQE